MRKLAAAFLVFVAILAAGYVLTRDTGAEAAFAEAEARVAAAIAEKQRVLRLDGLSALEEIPPQVAEIEGLMQLSLNGTRVSDIGVVAGIEGLEYLALRDTRVIELDPVAELEALTILDLGGSWVSDLEPLSGLPHLERLGIGRTQLRTLEPATRIQGLKWINLHGAHAIDGSRAHYEALEEAGVQVNNGRAFRDDWRPDWVYRSRVRLARARDSLGLGPGG